ncbi:hypothetical protein ACWWJ3_28215, partial [Klebsiella pneumoniae]
QPATGETYPKSDLFNKAPQITRHKAASVTFGNDLADITDGEKIKHGLLVNLGKNIARQVSSGFSSRQHRPFRGKAKVQNHQ